jgi:hypothetical protein
VPPYPRVICSKIYRGYVKPRIIPKTIYRMSGLEVYKNTCLCFNTFKLYEIYVFNSVQSNSKTFYARPYSSMWAPVVARQIYK